MKDREHIPNLNFKSPAPWIATWFELGLIRPAPGTWGSLGAFPFGIIAFQLGGYSFFLPLILLITALGLWASQKFEEETQTHDNRSIVVDEVAGQLIAMLPAANNPILLILSFLFFRLFDVKKPWPISVIDQKMPGAWGVMGDDLVAGCMAALCVVGLRYAGFG